MLVIQNGVSASETNGNCRKLSHIVGNYRNDNCRKPLHLPKDNKGFWHSTGVLQDTKLQDLIKRYGNSFGYSIYIRLLEKLHKNYAWKNGIPIGYLLKDKHLSEYEPKLFMEILTYCVDLQLLKIQDNKLTVTDEDRIFFEEFMQLSIEDQYKLICGDVEEEDE